MKPTCKTCVYFEARIPPMMNGIELSGLCVRYPKVERKLPSDWCGEHKTAQNEKLTEKTHD